MPHIHVHVPKYKITVPLLVSWLCWWRCSSVFHSPPASWTYCDSRRWGQRALSRAYSLPGCTARPASSLPPWPPMHTPLPVYLHSGMPQRRRTGSSWWAGALLFSSLQTLWARPVCHPHWKQRTCHIHCRFRDYIIIIASDDVHVHMHVYVHLRLHHHVYAKPTHTINDYITVPFL